HGGSFAFTAWQNGHPLLTLTNLNNIILRRNMTSTRLPSLTLFVCKVKLSRFRLVNTFSLFLNVHLVIKKISRDWSGKKP
ncbi:hypothetical protein EWB00_000701, partial [Schistosoma japonicum]